MKRRGFTLIELLVVISTIGLLTCVMLFGIRSLREKTKVAKAKAEVSQIGLAVQMLYTDTRKYPGGFSSVDRGYDGAVSPFGFPAIGIGCEVSGLVSTDSSTNTSRVKDTGICKTADNLDSITLTGWDGPYYKGNTIDPWGHDYVIDYTYYGPVWDSDPANFIIYQVVGTPGPDYQNYNGNQTWGGGKSAGEYDCDDIYYKLGEHSSPNDATILAVLSSPDSHDLTCKSGNFQGKVN